MVEVAPVTEGPFLSTILNGLVLGAFQHLPLEAVEPVLQRVDPLFKNESAASKVVDARTEYANCAADVTAKLYDGCPATSPV